MDKRSDALLTLALDLPESARAEIAAALLQSLEPEPDPEVEKAWREEVKRRVAAYEAGETETIPWEQVHSEMLNRLNERRAG